MDIHQPIRFSYMLSIMGDTGKENTFFQEVTGFNLDMETEEIVAGGENSYKYKLPTTIKHDNLVLKRGLAPIHSELVKWIRDTIESGLGHTVTTKNIEVSLLSLTGETIILWTIFDAWPFKCELDPSYKWDKECPIKSLELAFNKFTANKMVQVK